MDQSQVAPSDPAECRRKATAFRRIAETARDPVAIEELLRLAAIYEQMAHRAEGGREH
jgi:hypothetical protein